MARVDYYSIEKAIQTVLKADPDMADVDVLVEQDVQLGQNPTVAIYIESRSAPANLQRISAAKRTNFQVIFTLACFGFSLDIEQAMKLRDDLMGKVETALMKNPSLNNAVSFSYLSGGQFENATANNSFIARGDVTLVAEVSATV